MDSRIAEELIRSPPLAAFASEEEINSWSKKVTIQDGQPSPVFTRFNPGSIFEELWDRPLLRVWDCMSGSRPQEDGRMLARASRMDLSTWQARETTLKIHADHKKWEPTPYISFTDSPAGIRTLAQRRRADGRRGDQTLVVIDPRRRFRLGLPILRAEDEMRYYRAEDPYCRRYQYYTDHYLCLWEVTPEEIVDTWDWNDLSGNQNWYKDTILPAFQAFRQSEEQIASTEDLVADMSSLTVDLPAECPPKAYETPKSPSPEYPDSESDANNGIGTQHVEYDPSHHHERPGTEWSYELQGFYTEEEEYEQLGWNGNHERIIDGLWD
jgi:hypothetical protein